MRQGMMRQHQGQGSRGYGCHDGRGKGRRGCGNNYETMDMEQLLYCKEWTESKLAKINEQIEALNAAE